jgi:hypothetical protein
LKNVLGLAFPGIAQHTTDQQTHATHLSEQAVLLADLLKARLELVVLGVDAGQHFRGVDHIDHCFGHCARQRVTAVSGAVSADRPDVWPAPSVVSMAAIGKPPPRLLALVRMSGVTP